MTAVVLASAACLVYLLTSAGVTHSDDELYLLDTAQSVAVHGDFYLNQTTYLRPLQVSDTEPGQPVLAAPLYWLAYRLPFVGNVHLAMQFNPIVTALAVALIYLSALELGYTERVGLLAALLYGMTTIAWPYTQNFFRESLSSFTILLALLAGWRWRKSTGGKERPQWGWLVLAVGALLVSILSKEAGLLFAPYLALIVLPDIPQIKENRKLWIGVGIGLIIAVVVVLVAVILLRDELWLASGRYRLLDRLNSLMNGLAGSPAGIAGYLFSPARSIWMFSPVLLLAWAAPALLPRSRWRESWLPLAFTLAFALTYAAIRGADWYGGSSWGPRYMVPLTPLLLLAALPALDRITEKKTAAGIALLAVLGLAGLAVQIGAVAVSVPDYYAYQIEQTGFYPWWNEVIWSLRWNQAVGSLLYIGQGEPHILWQVGGIDWAVPVVIGAGIAGSGVLLWLLRTKLPARFLPVGFTVPVLAVGIMLFTLARGYSDPRYRGDNAEIMTLINQLKADPDPDHDAILLSSTFYTGTFRNYYKGTTRWYNLHDAPGERYSWEQEPTLVSDDVEVQLGERNFLTLNTFMQGGTLWFDGDMWLVLDSSPFLPWSLRPAEHYLNLAAYPVEVRDISPSVRMVRYLNERSGIDKPTETDFVFADTFALTAYETELAGAGAPVDTVSPGARIGVALQFEALRTPDQDYVVAVYLVDAAGTIIAQRDSSPVGGFRPTSGWSEGETVQDNHGFILPADALPGQYQLWLLMYQWPSLERLPVTGDGAQPDHYVVLTSFEVR